MVLNKKEIEIHAEKNIIGLFIKQTSDLTMLYCLIKNLLGYSELIPESVYVLREDGCKIKKSLNRFRFMNYWDFLDIREEVENTLVYKSENFEWIKIKGWEIRFRHNIRSNVLNEIVNEAENGYEGLINKLKKENNE